MVKAIEKKGKTLYIYEECGLAYEEKEWAEKCQQWCEEHEGTCNMEISEHSVDSGHRN